MNSNIDYIDKIPNNVDLGRDRVLQRALEHWQPAYMGWWYDMGPNESHNYDVYLRTAISVDPEGWAIFDYVKMPEYRWGIFLAPPTAGREVNFGVNKGQSAWQDVPGEYRSMLRRLIVTQGDTEPASVEQQKMLGMCAPSLYDLRNIYQVNVEEGRHLWAMVYLLHRYFGRKRCSSGGRAMSTILAFLAHSTNRRLTGWRSTCSRSSPIATASFSCHRWRSRASIRWRAPAGSC
jgi:benzoyl-CoA 2,3-epoxidase subunit B